MIEEPDSIFLGHVVPYSGHGVSIAVAIFRFLKARGWENDVIVVGSDGTNVNVGNAKFASLTLKSFLATLFIGKSVFYTEMNFHFELYSSTMMAKHLDQQLSRGP